MELLSENQFIFISAIFDLMGTYGHMPIAIPYEQSCSPIPKFHLASNAVVHPNGTGT